VDSVRTEQEEMNTREPRFSQDAGDIHACLSTTTFLYMPPLSPTGHQDRSYHHPAKLSWEISKNT